MSEQYIKTVALVGASGNLGSRFLAKLVKGGKHNVTVITRPSSSASYPAGVTVKKGQYTDVSFLTSALQGVEVLVLMLGFAGRPDQDNILQGAAKAGVKYVFPTEYGAPSDDERQQKALPLMQVIRDVHARIEELGMRWIGTVTGGWIDYVSFHHRTSEI
jgi:uncharacterized protein YbjT (DUF2867 family)